MLKYIKLNFVIEFETKAELPLFKGNIFRSAFGKSLRKIACPVKNQNCNECILSSNCVYFSLFESPKKITKNKSPNRPVPLVLEVLEMQQTRFSPKDRLTFHIILIEDAIKQFPYVFYSISNMGKEGIGFNRKEGLGKFKLILVNTEDEKLYPYNGKQILKPKNIKTISVEQDLPNTPSIKIDFITPYRVKSRNSLVTTFDFSTLIRACLRRISQLEDTYYGKEPPLDYKGIIKKSQEIKKVEETKKWFEIKRYSFRQGAPMKLGGLIGSATYMGDLGDFLPILKYCEIIHVGKQTSFGFGKFHISQLS